jgi:hypothetical protein
MKINQIIWAVVDFLAITCSVYYALKGNFQVATYYVVLAIYANKEKNDV